MPDPVVPVVEPPSRFDGWIAWIKGHERLVLLAAAAFQVIFLVAMIGLRVAPLLTGQTILIRVLPVDPRDLFRGDYVVLSYEFSRIPPQGIEGIEVMDDGVDRDGAKVFGALGAGKLKMKLHKACIARLFERNDLVLDAETIADIAREIAQPKPA